MQRAAQPGGVQGSVTFGGNKKILQYGIFNISKSLREPLARCRYTVPQDGLPLTSGPALYMNTDAQQNTAKWLFIYGILSS